MDFEEQKSEKAEKTWEDTCEQNYEVGFINGLNKSVEEIEKRAKKKQEENFMTEDPIAYELQNIADSIKWEIEERQEAYNKRYNIKKS